MSGEIEDLPFGAEMEETPVAPAQPAVVAPSVVPPKQPKKHTPAAVTPTHTDLAAVGNAALSVAPAAGAEERLIVAVQQMAPSVSSPEIRRVVSELITAASLDSGLLDVLRTPTGMVSCVRALARVASLGLSVDPAYQHVWLIRRNNDVTFQAGVGLARLAISEAGCRVVTGIVREGENCHIDTIRGSVTQAPIDWASTTQRTPLGGWALLFHGDVLVGSVVMTAADIARVRPKQRSQAWDLWPDRMIERSLVVRAAKLCPRRPGQGQYAALVAELESDTE